MANNLFVSYDLYKPGQDYQAITKAITQLGSAVKIELSYWFVKSNLSAEDAANRLRLVLDVNDKLIVVDSTNNNGYWYNLDPASSQTMINSWNS